MELMTIITFNILFLILIAYGAVLSWRISVLDEKMRSRTAQQPTPKSDGDEEDRRAREAEKRFTEGIASILSYDLGHGREIADER